MRYHRSPIVVAASTAAFLVALSACASSPHNDVLIFGTDTKLALDVSTPIAAGGTPEITIGYKRREAVYMPLVVNGGGAQKPPNAPPGTPHPYTGTSNGPGDDRSDSYSVFASFGANLRGSRNQTASEAAAGLAQFFATGIAAQHLGSNSRVAEALAIQPGAAAAANARAAAAERDRELIARLSSEVGSERIATLMGEGENYAELEQLAAPKIEVCAQEQQAYKDYLARVIGNANTTPKVKDVATRLQSSNDADDRREAIRGAGDAASVIALQCNSGG